MLRRSASSVVPGRGSGILADGQRFAGQHRLVGVQFTLVKQTQVGRDAIAGGQQDDISRHQFTGVQLFPVAVATHRDRGRNAARQRRERALGLGLLPVADDGIDQHDAKNHAGVYPFAECAGDQSGCDQYQYQRLRKLLGQALPGRLAR